MTRQPTKSAVILSAPFARRILNYSETTNKPRARMLDACCYFFSNSSTAVVIAFTPVRIAGSGNG